MQDADSMRKWLGPLVRLQGISTTQLPSGGKSPSVSPIGVVSAGNDASRVSIEKFVSSVLNESVPFIDGVAPKDGKPSTWRKKGSPKHYPSSEAPVDIYEFTIPAHQINEIAGKVASTGSSNEEKWFCRRSCHRNASEKGTASWEEFVNAFRDHHHESEKAFTSTVIGAREALFWDTNGLTITTDGEEWNSITFRVVEMKHLITPKPLKNRAFPVVQLAASLSNNQEFLVVSIPINDFHESPDGLFSKDKSLVVGAYASIERIRVLPESGNVEWIMATVSNAKGVLPQWMQNLAVAGMVAHDVDFFLAWIPTTRGEGGGAG